MSDDGRPDLSWFDQKISEIGEVDTSSLAATPPAKLVPQTIQVPAPKKPKAKTNPYDRETSYEKVYDDDDEDQEAPLDSPCDIATLIAEGAPQSIKDLARQLRERVKWVAGEYAREIDMTIYIDSEDGCSEELEF